MNKLKIFVLLMACMSALAVKAQVTSVHYGISYDTVNCRWAFYMKIIAGSTSTPFSRIAGTGKLTLVVPSGSTVGTTVYSNYPRTGTLDNTVPGGLTLSTILGWTLANPSYSPATGPLSGYTVYDYTPVTSGSPYYPTLAAGDSVVLFSLNITTPTQNCGAGIRLWNNNTIQGTTVTTGPTDPISANMLGNDYNNGITIGSTLQRYTGNQVTVGPPKPKIIASRTVNTNSILLNANVVPGSHCSSITTYAWSGPNGFTASTGSATVSPLTAASFGQYTITATDNMGCQASVATATIPLPVTLSGFSALANKCSAALSWSTSSETSFDRFAVQYSADGNAFMTVTEVASKKSPTGSEYSYSYAQPSGKGYYRLKMIDLNGSFSYSETVSLSTNCGTSKGDISISPNPTSGIVNVRGIAAGTEIRIIDMLGKVVANEVSAGSAISVDLAKYANGIYNVLVAQNGGWEKVGQIVKN